MTKKIAFHKIRRDGGKFEARAGGRVLGTFDSELEADVALNRARADGDFKEEDHPRDKDGKFGAGGGGEKSQKAEQASQHAFEMSGRAAAAGTDEAHAAAQKAHKEASKAHREAAADLKKQGGDPDKVADHREAAEDHRYGAENHATDRDNIAHGQIDEKSTNAMQKAGKSPTEIAASHRESAEAALKESREAKESGDDVHAEAMQHVAAGYNAEAKSVESGSSKEPDLHYDPQGRGTGGSIATQIAAEQHAGSDASRAALAKKFRDKTTEVERRLTKAEVLKIANEHGVKSQVSPETRTTRAEVATAHAHAAGTIEAHEEAAQLHSVAAAANRGKQAKAHLAQERQHNEAAAVLHAEKAEHATTHEEILKHVNGASWRAAAADTPVAHEAAARASEAHAQLAEKHGGTLPGDHPNGDRVKYSRYMAGISRENAESARRRGK